MSGIGIKVMVSDWERILMLRSIVNIVLSESKME